MTSARRTAIVTGAARGIGAAVAARLARDGFAVAVVDLDESACANVVGEIKAAGGTALAVGLDVSDEAAVTAGVERIANELGEPTVLVNNAGVIRDNLLFKMTTSDWDTVMNVHLRGAFLMSRAVQAYQSKAKWGRDREPVEHLGARQPRSGELLRRQGRGAGLHEDPRDRARSVQRHRQRDRARLHRHRHDRRDRRVGSAWSSRTFKEAAASQIPVGRVGEPDDIAHAVSFYVSDGAGFVSGQVLYVAGGPKG